MPTQSIDLSVARTSENAKVFAGRKRGKFWRDRFKLDQLDQQESPVDVLVPGDVISLNISFFLNLFGESVRRLGREKFLEHYIFHCDAELRPHIDNGIEQALKRSSALPE